MVKSIHFEEDNGVELLVKEECFLNALNDVFARADRSEVLNHLLS